MILGRLDRYVTFAVVGAYAAALVFLGAMFVLFDLLFEMHSYVAAAERSGTGTLELAMMISEYHLVQMPLGNSDDIQVGDFVVAIGNPFGLSHTVTSGIVSALGRTGLSQDGYEDFIQTDASINPGNSGGALINLGGELIGINSAIFSGSGGNIGIGFAIPVNIAKSIMAQLIEYGEIQRGLLGVSISDFNAETAEALGMDDDVEGVDRSFLGGRAVQP